MSLKKNIIIGCSVFAGLALLVLIAVIAWVAYVAQSPKGLSISVDAPTVVKQDETFTITVQVINERKSSLQLGDIDFGDSYIKGFIIISSEPAFKSSQRVPVINGLSYTFDRALLPQTTNVISFKLRATHTGSFSGDLDVYEGMRSLSRLLQTEVK
ncbi:MAG: hypothetical protein JWR19_350 [Pedosphaera sp.]|nr:hypothetical protein [Pedosphaera sp.]